MIKITIPLIENINIKNRNIKLSWVEIFYILRIIEFNVKINIKTS